MLTPDAIKARAHELGFELCGIASADAPPELALFEQWLARGYHGEMEYMSRTADKRADPRQVLPSARSIIVLGTIYNSAASSSLEREATNEALISRYAWGDDYHDVIGQRMDALLAWIRANSDEPFDAKPYVDTGPVAERVFAAYAGLGWIGKNTCLINPEVGSWIFLSEIVCSLALEADASGLDQCGTCTLCIEACPTGAFPGERTLDATRCISYLTIELKSSIPEDLREKLGTHVYGCDICQEVCPFNADPIAAVSEDPAWHPRPQFTRISLDRLWRMSDDELRRAIKGTAMTRARVKRLRRNIAVAIGNSSDPSLASVFDESIDAPSANDPMVVEHVHWARAQLSRLRRGRDHEDHQVHQEDHHE